MSNSESSFSYQIHGNDSVLIICFSGTINSQALASLENLKQEIQTKAVLKCVVLNFAQVDTLTIDTIPVIAHLQKIIRDKSCELRLCSLSTAIKERLVKAGILRSKEIAENSKEALYSLVSDSEPEPKTG